MMFIDRLNCPFRPTGISSFSNTYLCIEKDGMYRFIYLNARYCNWYSIEELQGVYLGNIRPDWIIL